MLAPVACYFLRRYYSVLAIDGRALQRHDRSKMNSILLIGLIVFLVVFVSVWGAFPRAAKDKPADSNLIN